MGRTGVVGITAAEGGTAATHVKGWLASSSQSCQQIACGAHGKDSEV